VHALFSGRPRYYIGTYFDHDYVDALTIEVRNHATDINAIFSRPQVGIDPGVAGYTDGQANNLDAILSRCETLAELRCSAQGADRRLWESTEQRHRSGV
jgi:hypothetical protein